VCKCACFSSYVVYFHMRDHQMLSRFMYLHLVAPILHRMQINVKTIKFQSGGQEGSPEVYRTLASKQTPVWVITSDTNI
jgi:hypothetical protein